MSFSGLDPSDPRYTKRGALHLPAGDGVVKWMSGDICTVKATTESSNGSLGFVEAVTPPGAGLSRTITATRTRCSNLLASQDAKALLTVTPGGPEAGFPLGEDPRPGEQPAPWKPERLAELAELMENTSPDILPET